MFPTRITDRREVDLQSRRSHLMEEVERFSDLEIASALREEVEIIDRAIDEINRRRHDIEASGGSGELYRRYITKMTRTEGSIQTIEWILNQLDLHRAHAHHFHDRISWAKAVCHEILEVLGISVACYPVVSDGYSLLPIMDDNHYIIFIPSGVDPLPTMPILAHEMAHTVLDRRSRPRAFNDRFYELRRRLEDEGDQVVSDFYENWTQWYDELFCDVCGFFVFGPAYAASVFAHLLSPHPHRIHRNVVPGESDLHPPDALRIEVVNGLIEDHLPPELQELIQPFQMEFDAHLEQFQEPRVYRRWIDAELVAAITDAGKSAVGDELADLCNQIVTETTPSEVAEMEHRLRVNQYWLAGEVP